MSATGVIVKDARMDVQRMAEVTTEIVAAETPEQVLHRTFDRLNEVIPSPIWLAIWSGSGGNGAIVCAENTMGEGEAQQLVVNAIGRTDPEFRSKFVTPRFVRTYRRSMPDGRESPSGVPFWIDFAVQICDTTVLLSGFSEAREEQRQSVWPYVSTLVNCAVPCLINAHAAGKRLRRSARQAAGEEAGLNDALGRRITEAKTHGAELAFMLIGVSCLNGSKEREPASSDTVTSVSHLILTTVRESDEVFYASADKLGLIMPYTDPRNALIAADRIFARLANEQSAGKLSSARLTMGVSGLDPGVDSADDLRTRAGSALDEATKASCGAFLYV
jgi:GGDEF domain-containing protein